MKKHLPTLLFIIALHISSGSFAQQEVVLDLSAMPEHLDEYREQSERFIEVFHGESSFSSMQHEAIKYSQLVLVRNAMDGDHAEQYFTGLRLFYGLTDDNEVILYHMPLYANYYSAQGSDELFELSEVSGDLDSALLNSQAPIYYSDNGYLYDLRRDGLALEEAFANSERYKRYVHTDINYGEGLVYSVFFPFQEIDALYEQNRNTAYSTGYIYFTSTTTLSDDNRYYHRLTMSTLPPTTNAPSHPEAEKTFYSEAADLTHSCPSECQLVNYRVQ